MVEIIGKQVGSTGYGLMGLTWRDPPIPIEDAVAMLKAAYDNGCTYFNAGEFYGTPDFNSLHILKAYFTKYPEHADKVVLNVKGAMKFDGELAPDAGPEGIKRSIDNCLKFLDGIKKLDIFEPARVDPNVPIETTIEAIAEYVKAGKIGAIGLSEVNASTIRRAAKVHPIANAEIEMSLWSTDVITNGTLAACAELGIVATAYAPLGHGFLTGQVKTPKDLTPFQQMQPRFQPGVFEENLKLVEELKKIAAKKGCTPGQVGIAWVKEQSKKPGMPRIIAIPGASSVKRIEENSKQISLTDEEEAEIDELLKNFEVKGARYGGEQGKLVDA